MTIPEVRCGCGRVLFFAPCARCDGDGCRACSGRGGAWVCLPCDVDADLEILALRAELDGRSSRRAAAQLRELLEP
jgi:hypothetical protein